MAMTRRKTKKALEIKDVHFAAKGVSCEFKNDLDETVGTAKFGLFHGSFVLNDKIQRVMDRLEDLGEKFTQEFIGNNVYQYALNFDLEKEKVRLLKFIQGDSFKRAMAYCERQVEVAYLPADTLQEDYPKNIVCVKIVNDREGFPVSLDIGITAGRRSVAFDLNLLDKENDMKIITENDYSFLSDFKGFRDQIDTLATTLQNSENNEMRLELINRFNQEYDGKLSLEYTINPQTQYADYEIKDRHGLIGITGHHRIPLNDCQILFELGFLGHNPNDQLSEIQFENRRQLQF